MNHGFEYPGQPDEKEEFIRSAYREGNTLAYAPVQETTVKMKRVQIVLKA
jgi:hypothetical protein